VSVVPSDWLERLPFAVTVCDREGIIIEMNDRAVEVFSKYGGRALIGRSLLDCHTETSRGKLLRLLREGQSNIYTIEKEGGKKIIIQSPWRSSSEYAGLVEISIELPDHLPHFIRE